MYDYGACPVCGEHMEERQISQGFWIKGELVVVEGVPAGVCPRCGEKIVKADVGLRLQVQLQDSALLGKARTIRVPIVTFADRLAA